MIVISPMNLAGAQVKRTARSQRAADRDSGVTAHLGQFALAQGGQGGAQDELGQVSA